jgi:hypothetical protein
VAGLERHGHACDPVAFLFILRPPALQHVEQCALVDLLQRLALDTRNNANDKPARLVETSAEIVCSLVLRFVMAG